MLEKIIQISTAFDSYVNLTVYIALTNNGRVFKSYDLKQWNLVELPDLKQTTVREVVSKLNG